MRASVAATSRFISSRTVYSCTPIGPSETPAPDDTSGDVPVEVDPDAFAGLVAQASALIPLAASATPPSVARKERRSCEAERGGMGEGVFACSSGMLPP